MKAWVAAVVLGASPGAGPPRPFVEARASAPGVIRREALSVTLGKLGPVEGRGDGAFLVESNKLRAVAPGVFADEATLRFTYLGPTLEVAPLASGELRRQVGLKLRARDGCNVLYVMWRIEPVEELVVSVKENGDDTRSADCGTAGYRNVKPTFRAAVPKLEIGAPRTLRAVEADGALSVLVDGVKVWEGRPFGEGRAPFDGPVGLRTDNGRFVLKLEANKRR